VVTRPTVARDEEADDMMLESMYPFTVKTDGCRPLRRTTKPVRKHYDMEGALFGLGCQLLASMESPECLFLSVPPMLWLPPPHFLEKEETSRDVRISMGCTASADFLARF
jgi:hypothetical protein